MMLARLRNSILRTLLKILFKRKLTIEELFHPATLEFKEQVI